MGILQPTVNDFIGDPACGSARMLTHALDYVRKHEYTKAVAANGGKPNGINPDEPTPDFVRFRDNQLFGAEVAPNVMHVARVNTLMNGAQYADLKIMDSLAPLASITGNQMAGLPERPGFYLGGLTMILTNPPFGSKVTNSRVLEDLASRDGVSKEKGKVVKSLPQEVVFEPLPSRLSERAAWHCPHGHPATILDSIRFLHRPIDSEIQAAGVRGGSPS